MNSKNHNYFCSSYINKYLECVKMNIPIFGNEHGIDMCSNINLILEFSNCSKENIELQIDKIKKEQNK